MRPLDVPKGQPPSKNDVLGAQNSSFGGLGMSLLRQVRGMRTHASQNPNFNYTGSLISNGHNSLNINPNHAKYMFKLNSEMSNFQ